VDIGLVGLVVRRVRLTNLHSETGAHHRPVVDQTDPVQSARRNLDEIFVLSSTADRLGHEVLTAEADLALFDVNGDQEPKFLNQSYVDIRLGLDCARLCRGIPSPQAGNRTAPPKVGCGSSAAAVGKRAVRRPPPPETMITDVEPPPNRSRRPHQSDRQ
jgi:hypothetical protein